MNENGFDRDETARRYAARHMRTDPGVTAVYHLSTGAPPREIRLLEVNRLVPERDEQSLEPIDFGVDVGTAGGHMLLVLDVTPDQWERIRRHELKLPAGWSLDNAVSLAPAAA